MRRLSLILLLVFSAASTSVGQQTIPPFSAGERVALVGDSITHGGHYHSYIWLYYMTRFPSMPVTLINCGVGGDEARSILDRWDWDIARRNPTYITLTFGMNDTGYFGIYGKDVPESRSEAKVASSLEYFSGLVNKLEKTNPGTKIVMVGGSPYDETSTFNDSPLPGKNTAIRKIISAQENAAEDHGWGFVDFNYPMVKIAATAQAEDPKYSFCPQDRIHPDKDGQMVMAWLFLKAQGLAGKKVAEVDVDAKANKLRAADNCTVYDLRKDGEGISFDYLANALPYPCDSISEHGWGNIHSQRDAMKMIPFMEEFNQEVLRVRNLRDGGYRLVIDGQPIAEFNASELSEGINMAALTNTPQYRQASEVMYLNEERFEIEKHLREYVWMEYNMFKGTDQLFRDDWKSLEMVEKEATRNPFVAYSGYWFKKSVSPRIREVWQKQMSDLVETIYSINKPVRRHIIIEKI
jgi:lysophospholipase L1-like esterase